MRKSTTIIWFPREEFVNNSEFTTGDAFEVYAIAREYQGTKVYLTETSKVCLSKKDAQLYLDHSDATKRAIEECLLNFKLNHRYYVETVLVHPVIEKSEEHNKAA